MGWRRPFAFTHSKDAAFEETPVGEEFGVEQSSTGGTADEIVGEQRELDAEEGAGADAADNGSHAGAGVHVAAGLRAIFLVEKDDGMAERRRQ